MLAITHYETNGRGRTAFFALLLAVAGITACAGTAVRADVNSFTLTAPLNNATVRETVPIRIPHNMLSQSTYAQISIDGEFRAAPAVPEKGDDIYDWDTKSTFTTPDKPNTPQTTPDGTHTIIVDLYDHQGNEVAEGTSSVRVSNKITALPDGIHLIYKWKPNAVQVYNYHSELSTNSNVDMSRNTLQTADIKFNRSVEDLEGGTILLRDLVDKNGYIVAGATGPSPDSQPGATAGAPVYIQNAYNLASKYWTVDKFGELVSDNKPIGPGQHIGFAIPDFPPRRVNIGDSWEAKLLISLQWAQAVPTFVTGTARLDSFEWEDGYPTAKVVETYEGPATFNLLGDAASTASGVIAPVHARSVHLTRTVWFAYEAGMVIRVESKLQANTRLNSDQYTALGVVQTDDSGNPGGGPPPGPSNPYMGNQNNGMPPPGAPYVPRNPIASSPGAGQSTAVKLQADSTMVLAGVGGS